MISPPLIMPTPIQGHQMMSMSGPMMGGLTSPVPGDPSGQQPAMAFTYVPVPVYNIGGVTTMPGMPMMPGSGMPSMNLSSMGLINTSTGSASPTKMPDQASAKPESEPAATSTPHVTRG